MLGACSKCARGNFSIIKDVIVIGSGPAGATVGGQIAGAGFNVLIIEKESNPGKNKVCGGAVLKQVFEDLDLPRQIIEKEVNKLTFHLPKETIELKSEHSCVLFDREKFDKILAQKALKKGARLLNSTLVYDVTRNADYISIYLKNLSSGEIKEFRTRLVVFADGVNTLAHTKFRIGYESNPIWTTLAAAYDLQWQGITKDSLEFFFSNRISPFGYGWIFPRKGSINVGVGCLISKMQRNIKEYLDDFITEYLVTPLKIKKLEKKKYGARLIPTSIPDKIYSDSLLVVGDAAGTADPLSGSGIANAIINGNVAAKVAIKALESQNYTEEFLTEYETIWKKTINYRIIDRNYLLQRIALATETHPGVLLLARALHPSVPITTTTWRSRERD